jgi:trk system potassium uptake protein TrkA
VHVIVVGCGRVGAGLALACEQMDHTVAVIDRREKAFTRLGDGFRGEKIVGVGFDRDRLKAAGIERAGALAAVTNGDNSNILVARVARETFGIERVVARIYDPRRAAIYERVGIPTIATVQWATERVLHRILPERPTSDWVDPSAKVMLVERPVPASWAGAGVFDLESEGRWRIVGLTRLGVARIPTADLVAQDGDVIHAAVLGDASEEFEAHLAAGPAQGGAH